MKKALCAIFALVLLVVLAGAPAAEEAVSQQPTPGAPEGCPARQVVFALTTGERSENTDLLTVSAWLMQGVLDRYLETDVGYSVFQVRKDNNPITGLPDIQTPQCLTPETLYQAYDVISNLKISDRSDTNVFTAYQDALDKLFSYTQAAGDGYCPPDELWWIDWYETPLAIPADADETEDAGVAVYKSFYALLDSMPEMTCHFVFLATQEANEAPTEGERIADLLEALYPDQVTTDTIPMYDMVLARSEVSRIARRQLNAVLADTDKLQTRASADDTTDWIYTYSFDPANASGDALLTFTGPAALVSVRKAIAGDTQTPPTAETTVPETQETEAVVQDDPAALQAASFIVPTQDNPWFILLHGAPAGDYEIRLSAAGDSTAAPDLEAYKVVPERSVWFSVPPDKESADGTALLLYHDHADTDQAHIITVETDAVDFPPGQWHIAVYSGDEELPQARPPVLESTKENPNLYSWAVRVPITELGQTELSVRLSYPADGTAADTEDSLTLTIDSEPVTANVINRSPVISADAETLYPVLTDIPGLTDIPPLTIDLSTLFVDPDADSLGYRILYAGNAQDLLEITDGQLVYTLSSGSQDIGICLQADDGMSDDAGKLHPYGCLSDALVLTIRQLSVADQLLDMRLVPETLENLTPQEDGTYTGVTGTGFTIVWRLPWDKGMQEILSLSEGNPVFVSQKEDFLETLALTPQFDGENLPGINVSVEKSIDTETGDLLLILHAEPLLRGCAFSVRLDGSYGDLPLPDLCSDTQIAIRNSAPYLLDGTAETPLITAEITDYPWQKDPAQLTLAEILTEPTVDLAAYFTDEETSGTLEYSMLITGTAEYSWVQNGQTMVSEPFVSQQQILVPSLEDGTAPFALTILSPGDLTVTVTARDAEYASESALCWQIEVRSSFIRLLLIIGAAVLALCVLIALLLLIRQIRKPAFDSLRVSAVTLEAGQPAEPAPEQFIPLSPFKKKCVSVLSLLLFFRRQPLPGFSAKAINMLRLCPSRKGFAVLKLSKNAPRLTVTPSLRQKANVYLLTEPRVEISVAEPAAETPAGEKIVLFFQREPVSPSPQRRTSDVPADDVWES
jgi:hypothetical protein